MADGLSWGGITLVPRRMLQDGTLLPVDAVAWNLLQSNHYVVGLQSGNWCVIRGDGTEFLIDFTGVPEWATRDRRSNCWFVTEIQTYPYDEEFQHGWTWPTRIEAETAYAMWLLTQQD